METSRGIGKVSYAAFNFIFYVYYIQYAIVFFIKIHCVMDTLTY